MYKFILLSFISLALVSCGGKQSLTQKLVRKVDEELLKNHKLPYGNVIATYDLMKIDVRKNKRIFFNDYVLTINDEKRNNLFLSKFRKRYKTSQSLWNEAALKIAQIKDLIIKLHNKYKFLNSAEISFLKTPNKRSNDDFNELVQLDKMINGIPVMLPAHQPYVSSHYGMRKHPIKKRKKFHCGIDLVAHKTSPIYAAANGIVIKAQQEKNYGNMVIIKHSHNFKTRYAHLKSISISEGARVLRGEMIGTQGKSGHTTGEHLHYEVWFKDKHVDPFDFIAHSEIGAKR